MTRCSRATALFILAAAWAGAAIPLPTMARASCAFLAVFMLPGVLLERAIGAESEADAALPARALALSIGMIGVLGLVCSALGMSVRDVACALVAISGLLAFARSAPGIGAPAASGTNGLKGRGGIPLRSPGSSSRLLSPVARRALLASAVLTAAAVVLAAADLNIARDRMWYAAYVTRIATGTALDWHDPMLGTGRVVWRFAHNAWLLALGIWSMLSEAKAPWLIERCAPPVLAALVPFASYSLGYALFRCRERALVMTFCSLVVLLASQYPYFATERTPLFARLVEDKTAALVLLAPVAMALAVRALTNREKPAARCWVNLSLALAGVALAHGIVYLVVCISLTAFSAWRIVAGQLRVSRAAAVLGLAASLAIVPAVLGSAARADALGLQGTASTLTPDTATDPVVRAHLRMQRLRTIPTGGPIVEPRLLADPVLLTALAGLGVAAAAPGTIWGAYACSTAIVFLALAFAPFVAPAFGRAVVPWMAYRALWGVPFAVLLAGLVSRVPGFIPARIPRARARRVESVIIVLAAIATLAALPWGRVSPGSRNRLSPDRETQSLLRALAALPRDAVIAAAPGLSELVPAYSGRAVLAFADRGTVAIASSRAEAERRLRANAAIVALRGHSLPARRALMRAHGVTHVVYEHAACERGMQSVYTDGRFNVCATGAGRAHAQAEGSSRPLPGTADARWQPAARHEQPVQGASVIAGLDAGLHCRPAPARDPGSYHWRRGGRWSGTFTAVVCRAEWEHPNSVLAVRVRAHLPRAREALVYHVSGHADGRRCRARSGVVAVTGDDEAQIPFPCAHADDIIVRLAPAYLPYLSVSALDVLATN